MHRGAARASNVLTRNAQRRLQPYDDLKRTYITPRRLARSDYSLQLLDIELSSCRFPKSILMSVSSQHAGPKTTLSPQEKPKAGASWKAAEQHVLPYNRLGIVFSGFMASVFLAAMDQVSIPVNDLLIPDKSPPIDHRCCITAYYHRPSW